MVLALAQTLQNRVAMPDVLPTKPALAQTRAVAGTRRTIPSTVWVPGQATLSTGTAISLALVQLQPGHAQWRAHVQCLLGKEHKKSHGELGGLHQQALNSQIFPRSISFRKTSRLEMMNVLLTMYVLGCEWRVVARWLFCKTSSEPSDGGPRL